MKKIFIIVGLVVVIGAGFLISRPEKSRKPDGLERAQGEGGGAQASATEGREASAAPDNKSDKSVQSVDGQSGREAGLSERGQPVKIRI